MNQNSLNNLKGNTFKDKPERINKKGAPEKVLTSLTQYIEKKYGKRPPKGEVLALMEYIECLPVEQLTEFLKDKTIPVIIQAYGRLLLTGEAKEMRRVSAAEMINDRLHGRPKQQTDVTSNGHSLGLNIIVDSEQTKKEIEKIANK